MLKVLSNKEMKEVSKKNDQRTATMEEYKNYSMTLRMNKNRKAAVEVFWVNERLRLISGEAPTRNWTHQQIQEILSGHKPKHKGKTIQGHHTYSVRKYPQLASKYEVIYPVTFEEHLYEWHGGSFKNSLPGRPIKRKKGL